MAVYLNAFSMWKPGQLVTIEGKVYRVCYEKRTIVCHKCAFEKESLVECSVVCNKIEKKYMMLSYFKQVYPKT